ncbi:MAG: hypothetical protein M1371_04880 [Actinobacteria bacterium]|nr:hypothetical protein [Actinomycetota bacterium]
MFSSLPDNPPTSVSIAALIFAAAVVSVAADVSSVAVVVSSVAAVVSAAGLQLANARLTPNAKARIKNSKNAFFM